jgi:Putative Ig domain
MTRSNIAAGFMAAALLLNLTSPASACVGDCDSNGVVTLTELVTGLDQSLGIAATDCTAFDANKDGVVQVDELVTAVDSAVNGGCLQEPTPTPSPTAENQPPLIPTLPVYRTYPGQSILFPIDATDPEGLPLNYTATDVPAGAQLDTMTGIFSWTPGADQLGPFYGRFTVTDEGVPPQSADGVLPIKVSPLDPCTVPTCDPATGCTATLVPLSSTCCSGVTPTHVAEPDADCPGGRVVLVGRNILSGFGALANCDELRAAGATQGSGSVRINVKTRCLNWGPQVTISAHLETQSQLIIDQSQGAYLYLDPTGQYPEKLGVTFPIGAIGAPPGTEANLTVTVTDYDGVSATQQLRVILTPDPLNDLPD